MSPYILQHVLVYSHVPKWLPLLAVLTNRLQLAKVSPKSLGIQRKYPFLGYLKKYHNFWSNPKTWKVFRFVTATNLNLGDKQYTFQQTHSKGPLLSYCFNFAAYRQLEYIYPYKLLTPKNILFIHKYDQLIIQLKESFKNIINASFPPLNFVQNYGLAIFPVLD